jgi:hydrogenase-4 component B
LLQVATGSVAEAASASPAPLPVAASLPPPVAEQPAASPAVEASTHSEDLPPLAPPAPPVETAPVPEPALTWAEVLEVQKRLAGLGLDPGPLDGVVGPRTRDSVQRYDELNRRAAGGKVDRRLLETLRQQASSPILEANAP